MTFNYLTPFTISFNLIKSFKIQLISILIILTVYQYLKTQFLIYFSFHYIILFYF